MSDELPSWWPPNWEEPDNQGDVRATLMISGTHKYSVWYWGRKQEPHYTIFIKYPYYPSKDSDTVECDNLLEVLCVLLELERNAATTA